MIERANLLGGSRRKFSAVANTTLFCSAASIIALQARMVIPSGFSHNTCLPASSTGTATW